MRLSTLPVSYKEQFPAIKKEMKCRLIALPNRKEEMLGTSLLESAKNKLQELGEIYHNQVAANTEIVRLGRHHKRKRRPPRLYHMNYKDV